MTVPSFAERRFAWSSPPVDDIGYIPSSELLKYTDEQLRALVAQFERNRYGGWRNWQGRWRSLLLNGTSGKLVLDYGCGVGIEALQYAKQGNDVWMADISEDNLRLAGRILALYGFTDTTFTSLEWNDGEIEPTRWAWAFASVDVIHCVGVLHHIPEPEPVVSLWADLLKDDGEVRLMVYSDKAWRIATGAEPPEEVTTDPHFEQYWRTWDSVGGYADWYNKARLEQRFGEWFTVRQCLPLTERGEYLGAVLVKR